MSVWPGVCCLYEMRYLALFVIRAVVCICACFCAAGCDKNSLNSTLQPIAAPQADHRATDVAHSIQSDSLSRLLYVNNVHFPYVWSHRQLQWVEREATGRRLSFLRATSSSYLPAPLSTSFTRVSFCSNSLASQRHCWLSRTSNTHSSSESCGAARPAPPRSCCCRSSQLLVGRLPLLQLLRVGGVSGRVSCCFSSGLLAAGRLCLLRSCCCGCAGGVLLLLGALRVCEVGVEALSDVVCDLTGRRRRGRVTGRQLVAKSWE